MKQNLAIGWAAALFLFGDAYSIPCTPLKGSTAVVIGQDYNSIVNYTSELPDDKPSFGFMSYSSLRLTDNELPGILYPTNYGTGIQWVQGLAEKFPGSGIQLGLWLVGDCTHVKLGILDKSIHQLALFIKGSNSYFYLRIGYEFDSAENNYPADDYKDAFRHIVSRFRHIDVPNVHFVWHASGFQPRDNLNISSWFPGIGFVDWCGVSLFQQPYECADALTCNMQYADYMAQFCAQHQIPLMIAESTPFGGIIDEAAHAADPTATNRAGYGGASWDRWFLPVLAFIERHDVRMWSYINCDWDAQPMWAQAHAPGVFWGDSRIEVHQNLLRRWQTEVLSNSRFITSYSDAVRERRCESIVAASTAPPDTRPVPYHSLALVCAASLAIILSCIACYKSASCLSSARGYEIIP